MHLPVQSGSTRVLGAMRRRHTREEYLELVAQIREAIPAATLSTDMIVGFPGETVEDFEQTLSLVQSVQYHSIFSFKYSPRPNTLASKRMSDDVGEAEKTARIVALQGLQREIQTRLHERMVGTTVEVLIDAASRRREAEVSGRTTGNTVVNLPVPGGHDGAEAWVGHTVPVIIRRAGPNSVWGQAAGRPPEVAAGIDPA
jgi:tRNA-2-methylthio-N6-dimethylallyladenosine synthase